MARHPSAVPFAILLLLGAGLVLIVPGVLSKNTTWWALYLIAVTLGGVALLWLVSRTETVRLRDLVGPALWLAAALVLSMGRNPLGMMCLLPVWIPLREYLPSGSQERRKSFVVAVLLQLGFGAQIAGQPVVALGLVSIAILLVLWVKEPGAGWKDRRLAQGTLAVLLILIVVSPPPVGSRGQSGEEAPVSNVSAKGRAERAYLGLIFRPELKSFDKELPPPRELKVRSLRQAIVEPVEIPFSGVYWMYQMPLIRPPENAPEIRGTPLEQKYSSDDEHTPLRFEAIQSFARRYPSRRLRSIAMQLECADTQTNAIALELIATNSELGQYRMSLGRQPVGAEAGPQWVEFAMPPTPRIEEFDGLEVRVHLYAPRQFVAPKLELKSFRLSPR